MIKFTVSICNVICNDSWSNDVVRWQSGEWGVHFTLTVYDHGYEWQLDREDKEVLAPRGWYATPCVQGVRDGALVHQWGLGVARAAFNGFRRLSEHLEKIDVEWQAKTTSGLSSPGLRYMYVDENDRDSVLFEESHIIRKQLIEVFANHHGLLTPVNKHMTFYEWCREAGEFLDVYRISRMIQDGRAAELEQGLSDNSSWEDVTYRGRWIVVSGVQGPHMSDAPRPFKHFMQMGSRAKAWHVLNRIVGEKMNGALSLVPGSTDGKDSGIVNSDLRSLLYLRLWLDVKDSRDSTHSCVVCGEAVEGNRNKRFCSDAHRQKYYRQRKNVVEL